MDWQHFELRAAGAATVVDDAGAIAPATYELGIIETGKTRVYAGQFVSVTLNSGIEFSAQDTQSMIAALKKLATQMAAGKFELRCVGLNGQWTESGLSHNTGWGYLGDHKEAIHMMDAVPLDASNQRIGCNIEEAVAGMRIGFRAR